MYENMSAAQFVNLKLISRADFPRELIIFRKQKKSQMNILGFN